MKHKIIVTLFMMCALLLPGCGNAGAASVIITPAPEQHVVSYPDQNGGTVIIVQNQPEPAVVVGPDSTILYEAPAPAGSMSSTGAEILRLTNEVRLSHGLNELAYRDDLQEAANIRAQECSEQFSHTRPDGSSCHSIVENFDYTVTGENLIMVSRNMASRETMPELMMSEWMQSEGHKANILLPDFTGLAVGTYTSNGMIYAVQIFMG